MPKQLIVPLVVLGVLLTTGAAPASAHHAFAAEFDANSPVNFEGVVKTVEWLNPHVWIHLEIVTPDGTTEEWAFEGGAPTALFRRGFTRKSLLPGTRIKIDGFQAKSGANRASGRDITFPNGTKLFLGAAEAGASPELRPGSNAPQGAR